MTADYPFFFTWTAQKSARPLEMTGGDGACVNALPEDVGDCFGDHADALLVGAVA